MCDRLQQSFFSLVAKTVYGGHRIHFGDGYLRPSRAVSAQPRLARLGSAWSGAAWTGFDRLASPWPAQARLGPARLGPLPSNRLQPPNPIHPKHVEHICTLSSLFFKKRYFLMKTTEVQNSNSRWFWGPWGCRGPPRLGSAWRSLVDQLVDP